MKKIKSMTSLGKDLLTEKLTSYWDSLLTEKPHGDLSCFYRDRLAHFWSRPDLEKIIGKETDADPYTAMSEVNAGYTSIGRIPVPPPLGQKAFRRLLDQGTSTRPMAAYIHIPFCKIRCTYCSFFKQNSSAAAEAEYVSKLLTELDQIKGCNYLQSSYIDALFLGGGTPGTLTQEQLAHILQKAREVLPLSKGCEITIESSIYDMDEAKLKVCIENGANRFSFGVQTFDTDLRRQLGRPDPGEVVLHKLRSFAAIGPKIIIDLIYGLPGQTNEQLQKDLQAFLDCQISGIDLYKLQIFPGTPLSEQFKARPELFPSGKILADLFVDAVDFLRRHNCRQLSCCHWATDSREYSGYNTMVKSGAQVLAFGAGCGGNLGNFSFMQPADLSQYYALLDKQVKPFIMLLKHDEHAPVFEAIKGQLDRGVVEPQKLTELSGGIPFAEVLEPLLTRWQKSGLMHRSVKNSKQKVVYELSPMGLFWQNQLARAILIAAQYLIYGPRIAGRAPSSIMMHPMENKT